MSVARRTRVKMCGMTSPADIALAVAAGADAVGIILAESPRRVDLGDPLADLVRAIPPFVEGFAVVANQGARETARARSLGLRLQFSGSEMPETCEELCPDPYPYVKAFHLSVDAAYEAADFAELEAYARALWMFDSTVAGKLGGTGVPFAWDVVAPISARRPVVMSGGLTPDNVAACIRAVRPYAVDVRSGVETDGRKDDEKMRAFVRAVRKIDAEA